jgi:hypothetical protein
VIGLDPMGSERLAQVERLAWVQGVVGERKAGDELNQVHVWRGWLARPVYIGRARGDEGKARIAEAVGVLGIRRVAGAQVGAAAGAGGALVAAAC